MAGLDQELGVRPHEGHGHRHLDAIGEQKVRSAVELLDDAEDVVPASGIEPPGVVAQLVEDLVHFEGGGHHLDEDSRLDRATGYAESVLGELKDVVPQPSLAMVLELGQVEVRRASLLDQSARVVEKVQSEIEQGAGNRLAIHKDVLFRQMPAAGADQ